MAKRGGRRRSDQEERPEPVLRPLAPGDELPRTPRAARESMARAVAAHLAAREQGPATITEIAGEMGVPVESVTDAVYGDAYGPGPRLIARAGRWEGLGSRRPYAYAPAPADGGDR